MDDSSGHTTWDLSFRCYLQVERHVPHDMEDSRPPKALEPRSWCVGCKVQIAEWHVCMCMTGHVKQAQVM